MGHHLNQPIRKKIGSTQLSRYRKKQHRFDARIDDRRRLRLRCSGFRNGWLCRWRLRSGSLDRRRFRSGLPGRRRVRSGSLCGIRFRSAWAHLRLFRCRQVGTETTIQRRSHPLAQFFELAATCVCLFGNLPRLAQAVDVAITRVPVLDQPAAVDIHRMAIEQQRVGAELRRRDVNARRLRSHWLRAHFCRRPLNQRGRKAKREERFGVGEPRGERRACDHLSAATRKAASRRINRPT